MNQTLQKIRADLRRSMNGIVSTSMRQKGLEYKLNFGVDIPRLRKLSLSYPSNAPLAELLWKQETRELKILATLLFPPSEFLLPDAERWASEIPNQEIREQLCMNLLQKTPFAPLLVKRWTESSLPEARTSGYCLLARLLITQSPLVTQLTSSDVIGRAVADLSVNSHFLRLSAQNALVFWGRKSEALGQEILAKAEHLRRSEDEVEQEIYHHLQFVFA